MKDVSLKLNGLHLFTVQSAQNLHRCWRGIIHVQTKQQNVYKKNNRTDPVNPPDGAMDIEKGTNRYNYETSGLPKWGRIIRNLTNGREERSTRVKQISWTGIERHRKSRLVVIHNVAKRGQILNRTTVAKNLQKRLRNTKSFTRSNTFDTSVVKRCIKLPLQVKLLKSFKSIPCQQRIHTVTTIVGAVIQFKSNEHDAIKGF